MNILVLNGSPRGEKGRTLRLTEAFIEGVKEAKPESAVEFITIKDANIDHCRGCGACWRTSPGKCVIEDDLAAIHKKYVSADLIIWSFPLYIYGAPSKTKACMDRLVFSSLMPQMYYDKNGVVRHPWRFKGKHERQILVSSCGFPQIEHNYDALLAQMDIINGNITNILCCASAALAQDFPLFKPYRDRVEAYLADVKQAGIEYLRNDNISLPLLNRLKEPLVPPEEYMELFNSPWSWNYVDER